MRRHTCIQKVDWVHEAGEKLFFFSGHLHFVSFPVFRDCYCFFLKKVFSVLKEAGALDFDPAAETTVPAQDLKAADPVPSVLQTAPLSIPARGKGSFSRWEWWFLSTASPLLKKIFLDEEINERLAEGMDGKERLERDREWVEGIGGGDDENNPRQELEQTTTKWLAVQIERKEQKRVMRGDRKYIAESFVHSDDPVVIGARQTKKGGFFIYLRQQLTDTQRLYLLTWTI
uniref:Uncharacterized protein n=1 Tax=Chromera velia CCMP2878 TaxID=1169474 RepID=A0A0G4H9E1_9ALVE|eukprot:Cvel_25395.t1-p1 / transcript=Cvel_25395.t1 / gene=Cvel_25395 / organism=Chromera_velia_CCMP2878 / gene_product=hypothetical protein / transcript_product=hypothetical protein / location=Cvel_scaffold2871:20293-20979(+) / protein_length=229 / sequence_SO=supercontig / SO=protein_coding / is_pseudo=false